MLCDAAYMHDGGSLGNEAIQNLVSFNSPHEITSGDWPDVGDWTGIWEWMNSNGYPDTRFSQEYFNADLNNEFPEDMAWHIDFFGQYCFELYGYVEGYEDPLVAYFLPKWHSHYFGFVFDGHLMGADRFVDGDLDGWHLTETGGSVDLVTDPQYPNVGNDVMRLTRDSDQEDGVNAYRYFLSQTGYMTAQAKINVSNTNWAYFLLKDSNTGWFPVHLTFKGGRLQYYTDAGFQECNIGSGYTLFNANQWYTVKVVVDIPNQVYKVYLDGVLVEDNAVFYKGAYTTFEIDHIYFQAGWFGVTSPMQMWVDDVLLSMTYPWWL